MNANQPRSRIQYHNQQIQPGSRRGRNRQNFIKRQKARIRQLEQPNTTRSNRQSTQPSSRSQSRNNINTRPVNRNRQATVRAPSSTGAAYGSLGTQQLGDYVATVLDPFYAPQNRARVPGAPFPSACLTMSFTGNITTNAAGNFGVYLSPQAGVTAEAKPFVAVVNSDDFIASNNFFSAYNNAASVGYRTDYIAAGLTQKMRIVGAGIRCWYIGKETDRSGYFYSTFLPRAPKREANGRINGGYTEDQLREAQFTTMVDTKQRPDVIWLPREDVDYDYMDTAVSRDTSVCVIQGFGLPVTTTCVKWEAIVHAEYIPDPTAAGARLLATDVSVANPATAKQVITSVVSKASDYPTSPDDGSGLWTKFKNGLVNSAGKIEDILQNLGDLAYDYAYGGNRAMGVIGRAPADPAINFANALMEDAAEYFYL